MRPGPKAAGGNAIVRAAGAIELAIDGLCSLLVAISGIALIVILAAVVVLRYLFASGVAASVELTELSFTIFVMAGIALAARHGAHVTTRLAIDRLRGRAQLALALVIHASTAAVYLLLAWYAGENAAIAHDQRTPVLDIPYSVGYGILAAGLVLVSLSSLAAIVKHTLGGVPVPMEMAELHA